VFVVLLVIWALGLAGLFHIGGWIWLLFIAACMIVLIELTGGTRNHPI
jgi:hypothetical protein